MFADELMIHSCIDGRLHCRTHFSNKTQKFQRGPGTVFCMSQKQQQQQLVLYLSI